MDPYNNLVKAIRTRLEKDLPGYKAHQTMMRHRSPLHEIGDQIKKARQSAVLLLLYPKADEIYTVFIKRPAYDGVHSGQIALPGGKVEPEDNSLADTALREANEELGIIRDRVEVIGALSPLYIPPSNFMVHPYIAYTNHIHKYIPDPTEVEDYLEVRLRDFNNSAYLKDMSIEVRGGQNLNVKAYEIDGQIIWGATSMIMAELAMIMEELNEPL